MSDQEQFDDLVRRKLEERSFPFVEADWQAAHRLVQADRARRRRQRQLPYGAAALLIIGVGIGYVTMDQRDRSDHALAGTEQVAEERDDTPSTAPAPHRAWDRAAQVPHTPVEADTPVLAPAPASAATPSPADPHRTTVAPAMVAGMDGTLPAARPASTRSRTSTTGMRPEPTTPVRSDTDGPLHTDAEAVRSEERSSASAQEGDGPEGMNDAPPAAAAAQSDPARAVPAPASANAGAPTAAMQHPGSVTLPAESTTPTIASNTPEQGAQAARPPEGTNIADSASAPVVAALAADSSATNTVDTAAAAPLVRPTSPWEVGVMGGLLLGQGRYSGAGHELWDADVTRGTGWSVGAEVMHMGRNAGIGTGIHFSTYAERLTAHEQSLTGMEVEQHYFLTPVDTTVTVSTGTVLVNGQLYQIITSVDTVINVLDVGYDTSTTVTVQRAARALVNRVSYLEVPLLVDAHLTQGRWQFGVRGGPTLGVLTGRRGALPDPAGDGYTDLNDVRFRSLVFGWTVRACLRYRWNSAWSIGLEPVLRGQFGSGLEGDLKRRTMAYGVMVGLTYRLR